MEPKLPIDLEAAADAECLRRIRDDKLYISKSANWNDFCAPYLGASKTHFNRMIRYLEEFGPEFFHLTQLTRMSPVVFLLA